MESSNPLLLSSLRIRPVRTDSTLVPSLELGICVKERAVEQKCPTVYLVVCIESEIVKLLGEGNQEPVPVKPRILPGVEEDAGQKVSGHLDSTFYLSSLLAPSWTFFPG